MSPGRFNDKHMKLGQIISAVDALPDHSRNISFLGFWGLAPRDLHSYRGYYEDLAIGYSTEERVTAGELLENLRECVGGTFHGWKGGDYVMDIGTPVWISQPDEASGLYIAEIRNTGWSIEIVPAMEEED